MNSQYEKSCLSTNIPTTDETLEQCDRFLYSKCIVEGDLTQEEINLQVSTKLKELSLLLTTLQNNYNQNVSTNNIVQLLNLGIITQPIQTVFNNQPQFSINKNEIYIIKATVSGTPTTYIFTRGKGVYGVGGTVTTATDFIAIS